MNFVTFDQYVWAGYLVFVVFICLLVTHYLALKIGYRMGSRTEPMTSLPEIKKSGDYKQTLDVYETERMDLD